MASVYRKNAKWYVRFKDGAGRWRDTATKASLKTEAKQLAKELERKAERQRRGLEPLPGKDQSLTFGELMDWWWQEFGRRLRSQTIRPFAEKHFRASLGPLPLTSVTAAKIESVLRKPEDLSAESLNHLRAFTHRLFALAQRHGLWTGCALAADFRHGDLYRLETRRTARVAQSRRRSRRGNYCCLQVTRERNN